MTQPPTKHEVRTALGFDTDADLADLFGISRSAVAQWEKDKPIPELRWLQLRELRPGVTAGEAK